MIRLISLVIGCLFTLADAPAQDLFSLENSKKFARYLYDSGQYELASDEYERVVFLDSQDSISMLRLLSSYRLQQNYDLGLKRAFELLPETRGLSNSFFKELFRISVLAGQFDKSNELITQNGHLDSLLIRRSSLGLLILEKKWKKANDYYLVHEYIEDKKFRSLGDVIIGYNQLKQKSPYLAAGLSTVVPGLGKVYTENWQDGLIAFLFVATNAWQAYRGFSKDGINSTYGWIFGSIGTGFWLGNIYGSYKSAKKYNYKRQDIYYENASQHIFNGM